MSAIELVKEFSGDVSSENNVIGSLAVLAGIAASDAICGLALGRRVGGESHDDAVKLLATATVNGPGYAKDLRRILGAKSNAQYSPAMLSGSAGDDLVRWATRLVEGMERELAGPTR